MWSSTISTSATVLMMISRCRVTRPETTATRYRSVQPVNRYVSCSCYPLSSAFIFLYQSPPGFLFLQVTNPISRSICCRRSCSRFSEQPPGPLPRSRCDSRSTLSGSAASRSVMSARSRSCPAISLTTCSVLPSGRSRFVLCHFYGQFHLARRSVSRRMALQPAACASTLCRDRFAISGSRLDAAVGISPHATTGDGTGSSTDDLHRQFLPPHRCQDYHGQSDTILHIISQQALSVTATLQGHELRIPGCLSPVLHR